MNFSTTTLHIPETTKWTSTATVNSTTNWTYTTEATYTTAVTQATGATHTTGWTHSTPGIVTTPGPHTIHHEQVIQLKVWQMAVFVSIFGALFLGLLFHSLRNVLQCAFRRICKSLLKRGEEASSLVKEGEEIEHDIEKVEEEFKTGGENSESSERPTTNENTDQPAPNTGNTGSIDWLP